MEDKKLIELNELDNVLNELRRVVNFFQDETSTDLWIEDYQAGTATLVTEMTGNTYRIKIEKIN